MFAFLSKPAYVVAPLLIGWQLLVIEQDGSQTGGSILETEAYIQHDAASHSYKGQTPRNTVMFGPPGAIYVHFTYGMHWCMNIVTGKEGSGEAVLLRALLPKIGITAMQKRRKTTHTRYLADGPAKLCQALGISGKDNGFLINKSRIHIAPPLLGDSYDIIATPRIGIKKDTQRLWRFVGNPR